MLVVIALGGNTLLRRGQARTADNQRANVRLAAQAIAPVAAQHDIVISHGNGSQAGLLPLLHEKIGTDPLGGPGSHTEGMIGYLIEQELGNLLPFERPFATLLTMVEVDRHDPAFSSPTTFVGPACDKAEADRLAREHGWVFKQEGAAWRRVVASPQPQRMFELRPIRWLLDRHTIVIAAGIGIPTMYQPGADRRLVGVECVIDKDLASELLARELHADLLVMLTDVNAVYVDWGKPTQQAVRRASPDALAALPFAAGSMGPKVDAACRFARTTGHKAAIGALADLTAIVAGTAGTTISTADTGLTYHGAVARPAQVARA